MPRAEPTPRRRSPLEEDLSGRPFVATWHLLASEFPPGGRGVSDYTHLVARGLAEAGDAVHVWCPPVGAAPPADGVTVHQELGSMRPADLRRVGRALDRFPGRRHLLVQWVPHGFGYRSMNLPFCIWLWWRSVRHDDRVEIMVHEPYLAFWENAWRHAAIALVHRLMTVVLLGATRQVWVAIPAWESYWRPFALGRRVAFTWLPIPSGLPACREPAASEVIRDRHVSRSGLLVGTFGTYGPAVATLLLDLVPPLMTTRFQPALLLVGAGSEAFGRRLLEAHPELAGRVHATGAVGAAELGAHLTACDLLVQPYPDGISSRRTSAMAGLALGCPIVTTRGRLTEGVWSEHQAVRLADVGDQTAFVAQAEGLLADRDARQRLGATGRSLYESRFHVRHTIAALRSAQATHPFEGRAF
jgi:glycosyltransferase involved in cell wall biosynthesis